MKRCMSICCVFAMAVGLSFGVSTDTQAASSVKVIDGSKLTTDAESIGYNQKVARGEDLLTGYSKIVRMGPGHYYYRVRCIHSAGQDMSSSFTNGVYIEEP